MPTKYLFTNVADTHLTQQVLENSTIIHVEDSSNFPSPSPGSEERIRLTLIGACSENVEIVDAVENCGGCFKLVARGLEGTTPKAFAPGDYVRLQLTAEMVAGMYEGFRYYLGPHPHPGPTKTANGDPLEEGMYYWDTTYNETRVWNDEPAPGQWQRIHQVSPSVMGRWVWYDGINPIAAGSPLPDPDIYGNSLPMLLEGVHYAQVFVNGIKWMEEIDPITIEGDYIVTYGVDPGVITVKNEIPAGATVQVLVSAVTSEQGWWPKVHTHLEIDFNPLIDKYTKAEVDAIFAGKLRTW